MTPVARITILGGGLAGGLIAYALARRRPEIAIELVERGGTLGGNHVWSFFDSDVAAEDRWIVDPFVSHTWHGYEVRFPAYRRLLGATYRSIESGLFDRVLQEHLPEAFVRLNAAIDTPPDGPVIDARGAGDLSLLNAGWQKFVGLSLETDRPHGLTRPIVMDATVAQLDGYRFVYVLPFGPTELFIEDTYYSDTADLDVDEIRARVLDYAATQGWRVTPKSRCEAGVLPVVIGGDFDAYWRSSGCGVAKAGMRAGLFHPTTGYSLPDAVRLAAAIVRAPDLSREGLEQLTRSWASRTWKRRGFYRLLGTMMFRAAEPAQRYRVLERFYRLDEPLIGRFYAGAARLRDSARILIGRPPVPIGRAVAAILKARK